MAYGIVPYDPVASKIIARMTGSDAKTYLAISAHVRARTWQANPTQERLAGLTGLTERAVRAAVRRLEGLGLLRTTPGCGRGHVTIYQLTGNAEYPFRLCQGETRNGSAINPERARPETRNGGAPCKEEEPTEERKMKNRAAKMVPPAPPALPSTSSPPVEPWQTDLDALIVGTALDSPTFREAWGEYEQHRAEGRNKLTPTARKQAVKKLLPIGSRRAVDAIRHSIGNGWRGIFEPKAPGGGGPSSFTPAAAPPGTYANVGKQY